MDRRRFIRASAATTAVFLAGCGNPGSDDDGGGGYDRDEPDPLGPA